MIPGNYGLACGSGVKYNSALPKDFQDILPFTFNLYTLIFYLYKGNFLTLPAYKNRVSNNNFPISLFIC